jgi:drug/metabolite transporter (DMT)-like permease
MLLHQSSGRWRLGLALSLLTVFLWGILPIALTVTLQVLDVYTVTWFRFLLSFGLLGVYLTSRQQLPFIKVNKKGSNTEKKAFLNFSFSLNDLPSQIGLLAIATVFLGLNYLFYLQGLAQTSPATAQVLIQLAPVLMGLGAIAVFKERYNLQQWAGLGVLTLGFVLFFHEQLRTLIASPNRYLTGSALLVIAAAVWAVYALAQKQLLQKLPSSNIMLIIYGMCALMFSPFITPQPILTLTPLHLGMLLFCGLNTLIGYGAFAESLAHWEASKVSAVLATTPIVTLSSVWAVSFFTPTLLAPEQISFLAVLGAILVVLGSIAIALGKKQ